VFQANFAAVSDHPEASEKNPALHRWGFFIQGSGIDIEAVGSLSDQGSKAPI
jgi:hypothetical protein